MWLIKETWYHRNKHILSVVSTVVALLLVVSVDILSETMKSGFSDIFDKLGLNTTMVQVYDEEKALISWPDYLKQNCEIETISLVHYQEKDDVRIIYCDEVLSNLFDMPVKKGRHISYRDILYNDNVAVLGHDVWLDHDCPELNDLIEVNGIRFKVIGILRENEASLYLDSNNCIFIPHEYRYMVTDDHAVCYYQETDHYCPYYLDQLLGKDNYLLVSQKEVRKAGDQIVELLGKGLSALAMVAMIVALLGLTNSSLSMVSQRSYEIGIKRSLGAGNMDIMTQFVLETFLLLVTSLFITAVILSVFIFSLKLFFQIELTVNYSHVAEMVTGILLSGVLLGMYPAYKAGRITIMEAIRSDMRD